MKLSDTLNNEVIKQYDARSQTLIVVKTGKKKVTSVDLSSILQDYARTNDVLKFEKEFTVKVNELIKQK